jgi:hypothetical protein
MRRPATCNIIRCKLQPWQVVIGVAPYATFYVNGVQPRTATDYVACAESLSDSHDTRVTIIGEAY